MFFVYTLFSENAKRTYVGFASVVKTRLKEHNAGKVKATKPYRPWVLLFVEECNNQIHAKQREKYWKSGAGRRKIKKMFDSRSS